MKVEHSHDFTNIQLSLFKIIEEDKDFLMINHKFKHEPTESYLKSIITNQIMDYLDDNGLCKITTDLIKYNSIGLNNFKIIKNMKKMKLINKTFILLFYNYYLDTKAFYILKNKPMPKINFKNIVKEEIVNYLDLSTITTNTEGKKNSISSILKFLNDNNDKAELINSLYNENEELLKYKISTLKLAKELYSSCELYYDKILKIIKSTSESEVDRNLKDLRLSF